MGEVIAETGVEVLAAQGAAQAAVRDLRRRIARLDDDALDLLLRGARSHYSFTDQTLTDAELAGLYELCRFGPTSANSSPGRIVFVRSRAGRERLSSMVAPGNVAKVLSAPVTAIIAYDPQFWRAMPRLFPHRDMSGGFRDDKALADATAQRNSALQGAYLMLAARGLGLDVGPMSGFDHAKVDAGFLADLGWKSNFLCNIGHGREEALFQRLPRLDFAEACRIT